MSWCTITFRFYQLVNVGAGSYDDLGQLEIQTEMDSVLRLKDLGIFGQMAFIGDVSIGNSSMAADVTLSVHSASQSQMAIHGGRLSEAKLILTSGPDRGSIFSLISLTEAPDSDDIRFDIVVDGSPAIPKLEWRDGSNSILSVKKLSSY